MNATLILMAAWLYAGRALLLCLLGSGLSPRPAISMSLWFGLGLVCTPLAVAGIALAGGGYIGVVYLLVALDLLLILLLGARAWRGRITAGKGGFPAVLFAALCMLLAWYNGPMVEHLSDAWWHMGNIASMRDGAALEMPLRARAAGLFSSGVLAWLGVDFGSYRLQAILSWLTGANVLESWYASTVVVTGLLAISVLLLMHTLMDGWRAVALGLLCWLLILGGMNSGFRIAGWPAGMGYVFLNLGLVGTYQAWAKEQGGVVMLAVAMGGMALFHLAELYLLVIALGALFAASLLIHGRRDFRSVLFPLVLFLGVVALFLAGLYVGRPPSRSAIIPALVMILALWGIRQLLLKYPARITIFPVAGLVIVFGVAGISWPHLWELFVPAPLPDPGYYLDYIPKYLIGWGDKLVAIPKWEHQLRASLLWTGVLSPLVALWLTWRQPGPRSRWLLVMSVVPWLILLSPPLFSLAVSPIPVHGGYRVQFLIPVAMVLGQGLSLALAGGFSRQPVVVGGRPLRLLVISAILLAITPDLLTRTGTWADRPWAIHTNAGFHWRLLDARPVIRAHTSWRYRDDLARISEWSRRQPPAAFVADLATSYYVAAETALYPAIRQRHHDRMGIRLKRRYQALCDGRAESSDLMRSIRQYNDNLPRRYFERARYVITNRDTLNYTAEVHGGACVGETEHLEQDLQEIADIVIGGEFLTLWQLRDSRDD